MQLLEEAELDPTIYAGRPKPTCWVYEVWTARNELAYVGVADDFKARWAQHESRSWWLREIRVGWVDVRGYLTRRIARMWEAATINDQSPLYNTMPEARSYKAYLSWIERDDADEGRTLDRRVFYGREL